MPQYDRLSSRFHTVNKTLHLDGIRMCAEQSIELDHYGPDGHCLCRTKRRKIIGSAELARVPQMPPRPTISSVMRPFV